MNSYRKKQQSNQRRMSPRSHLQRHLQKQSVRNLLMGIGGTLLLIIVMLLYGSDLLIKLSLLFGNSSTPQATKDIKEDANNVIYVEPPTLEPVIEATNSAAITVRGLSLPKQTVKLYVNDKFVDKTTTKSNKSFIFDIELEKGTNELKAKTVTANNKESNFSSVVKIMYLDKPPTLDITTPQDGQIFAKGNNQLKVTGKTDAEANITIKNQRAIVDGNGNFSYVITLTDGENAIKFVATDKANNKTEKEIKVKVE